MLIELINTFEELKKYVFIIDRGSNKSLVIKFNNANFYHLVGLHYTNIDMFFPSFIKSKDKMYKYMKNNIDKFDNILKNQIKEKDRLELRINTFKNIIDLLNGDNTSLYNLKERVINSMYEGDYGLFKTYDNNKLFCLLGLKEDINDNTRIYCVPQSWMASSRRNRLIEGKRSLYIERITKISLSMYSDTREKVTN